MDHEETLPPTSQEGDPNATWDVPPDLPQATPWANQWFGPYRVLEMLGRGGQGVVLKAHQVNANRVAALKLLTRASPQSRKRFRQEAQVLARLQHPNVIKVFDMGEQGKTPFVAMEFVKGRSLDRIVEEDGLPSPEWIVEFLGPIADALQYCHDNGIVHRDVKPENVLVVGDSGRPVLVDFGLVQRDPEQFGALSLDAHGPLSVSGEIKGSPVWMAPEQANASNEIGPWTDVHALGGLLYFLLVGQPPFAGPNLLAVLGAVANVPARDPRESSPDASPALAELCLRAMQKEPAARPASAREFAQALHGQRVSDRPAGGSPALRVALGGAVLLALLVVVGMTLRKDEEAIPPPQVAQETPAPSPVPVASKTDAPQPAPTSARGEPTRAAIREAKQHYQRALPLLKRKDRANGLAALARSLELDPKLAQAYYIRGKTYLGMGKAAKGQDKRQLLQRSVRDFTRYLDLEPKDYRGWNNRGVAYRYMGDLSAAMASYRRALELAPRSSLYHSNIGSVLREQGHLDEAFEYYGKALELKPNNYTAALKRGHIRWQQKRHREARMAYTQALAILPQTDKRRGKVLALIKKTLQAEGR